MSRMLVYVIIVTSVDSMGRPSNSGIYCCIVSGAVDSSYAIIIKRKHCLPACFQTSEKPAILLPWPNLMDEVGKRVQV